MHVFKVDTGGVFICGDVNQFLGYSRLRTGPSSFAEHVLSVQILKVPIFLLSLCFSVGPAIWLIFPFVFISLKA